MAAYDRRRPLRLTFRSASATGSGVARFAISISASLISLAILPSARCRWPRPAAHPRRGGTASGAVAEVARDRFAALVGKAGDLQGQVVLIRPEPRHGLDRLARRRAWPSPPRALVLRIAPRFEPHAPAAIERMRERAAVAGGEDVGIAGREPLVDGDAVLDRQACRARRAPSPAPRRCRRQWRRRRCASPSASTMACASPSRSIRRCRCRPQATPAPRCRAATTAAIARPARRASAGAAPASISVTAAPRSRAACRESPAR